MSRSDRFVTNVADPTSVQPNMRRFSSVGLETVPTQQTTSVEDKLSLASRVSRAAAIACRRWEGGGDPETASDAAANALEVCESARTAVLDEDGAGGEVLSRRARLAEAAWYLLLAGTDEHGDSVDLALSSKLFGKAARG